jgi:hypothetical protein
LEKWLVLMRNLAREGGKCGSFLLTFPLSTQHVPHGPDDPLRTINYHHLDISGQDGMDEHRILVGEMAGADEEFGTGG